MADAAQRRLRAIDSGTTSGQAFKCSLSDRIVMTAVRDAQGKLYEKKIAMLNGIDFLADSDHAASHDDA